MKKNLLLFILLLNTSLVLAQSNIRLEGWIFNSENGEPVSDVNIQLLTNAFTTISDDLGYFCFENTPEGTYDLGFEHIAYERHSIRKVHVTEDVPRRLSVFLIPKTIEGQTISIYAPREKYTSEMAGLKTTIEKAQIVRYEQLGIDKMLNQIAGLQVESSSTTGGEAILRIHGSQASQVLVLLDGQRLNNPQTGAVDLNMIPLNQINRIEIIPHGNTALFGGNAFAGVVQFFSGQSPEENSFSLLGSYGSFSTASGKLMAKLDFEHVSFLGNYVQDYSSQNYVYDYQNQTHHRENAWYRNQKVLGKLSSNHKHYTGNLLFNYRTGSRGLPSANFNEQLHYDAHLSEKYSTIQTNHKLLWSSNQFTHIIAGLHDISQIFNNVKDISPFRLYKSENLNRTIEGRIEHHYSTGFNFNLMAGYQHLTEQLNQKDLLYQSSGIGEKERSIQAIYSGFEFYLPYLKNIFQTWKLNTALRYEDYFGKVSDWYPLAGLYFQPRWLSSLNFSTTWSESIRYPDFNSLFWKGDARSQGNPELLPERNKAWNFQVGIRPTNPYFPQMQIRHYRESISDLIFWHRGVNGFWEPRNLYLANKDGFDVELSKSFISGIIDVQTAYNYNNARNLNGEPTTDGKKIIFIPQHTLNGSIFLTHENWYMQLLYRNVSQRETVAFNSKGTQLEGYQVFDCSIQRKFELNRFLIHNNLTIKNIFSEDYQLLFGYPMPGIELLFTLEIKWDLSN